ncbi:MAG: rhomboid family intramembrane serine protease [Opitutales bacterium]
MSLPESPCAPPTSLGGIPTATRWILSSNLLVFAAQLLGYSNWLLSWGALWPLDSGYFRPWQLVTYGWLHGGIGHIAVNMIGVFMFGSVIERVWGAQRFLVFYLACVIGAALTQLALIPQGLTIGASGGLFGLLLAFGLMFPNERLLILFFPFPVKAKWVVIGYGAVELFLGLSGSWQGVAHFAHLGGMLTGLLLILFWTDRLPIKPRPGKLW